MVLKRDDIILIVDYAVMNVESHIIHPIKGKSVLLRKNISMMLLEHVLENPRTHTGRGTLLYDESEIY